MIHNLSTITNNNFLIDCNGKNDQKENQKYNDQSSSSI